MEVIFLEGVRSFLDLSRDISALASYSIMKKGEGSSRTSRLGGFGARGVHSWPPYTPTLNDDGAWLVGMAEKNHLDNDWWRRNRLFHAALSGDYTTAKRIINENPNILKEDILESRGRKETVLHVAVGAEQATKFVRQLLRDFKDNIDMSSQDLMGNTPFFSACAAGNLEIVNEFLNLKNFGDFITISGGGDVSPLYIAVSFGHGEVASRLYYLALILLGDKDITCGVEIARVEDQQTALHLLSRKPPSLFATPKSQGTICSRILGQSRADQESSKALELVKELWNRILKAKNYIYSEISKEIQFPFHLLMEATKVGNHDFLVVILSGYPELIWERTHENETIFNFAVKNRHVEIFKLIHEVGLSKHVVYDLSHANQSHTCN
ncbi:hypothetical protein G4B88_015101 [Cannabis sativa]|uniref:Ankyrin repeat-containing protein n=1 Tax=Cannabis sativa TaxID=3483 RepID=A0A7J6DKU8_CANSA|nr:hypothetical protein G4B88_015101 [Cannabis sativa]